MQLHAVFVLGVSRLLDVYRCAVKGKVFVFQAELTELFLLGCRHLNLECGVGQHTSISDCHAVCVCLAEGIDDGLVA